MKEYIVNLKYGTWKNQVWFMGSSDADFDTALSALDGVGTAATNSSEFFNEAVKLFESYGFVRIQK